MTATEKKQLMATACKVRMGVMGPRLATRAEACPPPTCLPTSTSKR